MKQYVLYDKTHRAFIKSFSMSNKDINVEGTRSYDDALCFLEVEAQKLMNVMDAIKVTTELDISIWKVPWDSAVTDDLHREATVNELKKSLNDLGGHNE